MKPPKAPIDHRYEPLRILTRDEHVIFHRFLQKRLKVLRQIEAGVEGGDHEYPTQHALSEAVEITKIQQRIERGLAWDLGIGVDRTAMCYD